MSFARLGSLSLALAATMVFMIEVADARVSSGGSRGNRTFNTPPSTNTAPKPAAPIERSMTQPGTSTAAQGMKTPATATAPSRFGSGFGGLGGFASFLGLLLQGALIAGIVYLVMSYFRNRNQPALARASSGSGGGSLRDMLNNNRQGMGGIGGSAASADTLAIDKADFDAFEKMLGDIQVAYAREDTDRLGDMTTPEMLSYYSQDLADDKRNGIRYEVANVKLLQGDLSEAWQEPGVDYATVAMRFSMIDVKLDRNTGRVISGDRNVPEEVTEVWTFRRDHRAMAEGWKLSAVQQA